LFKQFVNFVLNIFAVHANSKFQFVCAAVSKIHSKTVTTKNLRERSLIVNCFVNFDKAFSTFHVTFIKIINVDKNNKRVY